MLTTRSQRWREKRIRFVDDLSVIDPAAYAVGGIDRRMASAFIAQHHYLGTHPAAIFAAGLFGPGPGGTTRLAGVAVFAVPATGAVVTRHTGLAAGAGCTLGRFILTDDVAGNGESFFLARALRLLREDKPAMQAVVSYADPEAGHIGRCYAALSGAYRGRTPPRTAYRIGDRSISGRTLSKIRLGEQGVAGAVDQLVAQGAPPPGREPLGTWLARLSREHILMRRQHPGLDAYCFEISRAARRAGARLPRLPYPRLLDPVCLELPLDLPLKLSRSAP